MAEPALPGGIQPLGLEREEAAAYCGMTPARASHHKGNWRGLYLNANCTGFKCAFNSRRVGE